MSEEIREKYDGFVTPISKHDNLIIEAVESGYFIADDNGGIYTKYGRYGDKKDEFVLKGGSVRNGYFAVSYKNTHLFSHRVVFYFFHKKLDENLVINHIDGNGFNNKISNLEMISVKENIIHSYRVLKRPPSLGRAKINKKVAEEIRHDRSLGMTYKMLMSKYGICKSSISYIVNLKTWRD